MNRNKVRLLTLAMGTALLFIRQVELAGQWTQGGFGSIWVEATAIGQRTRKRFNESGERQLWLGFGRADANVVALDVIAGVTPAVDLWFQLVFLDLTFSRQTADTLRSTGLATCVCGRAGELPKDRMPVGLSQ